MSRRSYDNTYNHTYPDAMYTDGELDHMWGGLKQLLRDLMGGRIVVPSPACSRCRIVFAMVIRHYRATGSIAKVGTDPELERRGSGRMPRRRWYAIPSARLAFALRGDKYRADPETANAEAGMIFDRIVMGRAK
jgi:hypothetical protein